MLQSQTNREKYARRRALPLFALLLANVSDPILAQTGADLASMRAAHTEVMKLKAEISREAAGLAAFHAQGVGTTDAINALERFRIDTSAEMKQASADLDTAFAQRRQNAYVAHQQALDQASAQRAQKRATWEAGHNERVAAYQLFVKNGDGTASLKQQLASIDRQVQDLQSEKALALDEIRKGLFCSQCSRSKSEIERQTGKSFDAHLTEVRGVAIGQSETFAAAKSLEFDQKIAGMRGSKNAVNQQIAAKNDQFVQESNQRAKQLEANFASYNSQEVTAAQNDELRTAATRDAALAQADNWKVDQIAQLGARQADVDQQIAAQQDKIQEQQKTFDDEVARRERVIEGLRQREPVLSTAFEGAANRVRQTALIEDVAERREEGDAAVRDRGAALGRLSNWVDADYTATLANARHRAGQAISWPVVAAAQVKADLSEKAAWAERSLLGSAEEPDSIKGRVADWGARAKAQFRALPANLRDRITKNVETLGSPTNLSRATIRRSLGTLKSGITKAVLDRASGLSANLPAGLAAAIDAAKPDVAGTVKAELMPTLEEGLVEGYVSLQEQQRGSEFSPEDRTFARTETRFKFFGLNISKLPGVLKQTVDETFERVDAEFMDPQ